MRHLKFPFLRHVVLAVFLAGMGCGNFSFAFAAPVDYLVDGWDTENNLPSSTVTAIAQTPDGYLWVGTYNGLARFDGARFVTFDPVNKPALSQARVQGLFLDATGTLWINTFRGGLTSYRDGVFVQEWPDQPRFDLHTSLAASSSNLVLFVTQFGEVLQRQLKGDERRVTDDVVPGTSPATRHSSLWSTFTPPGAPVFQCADSENRLWFLKRDGHVLQFSNGEFKTLPGDGGLSGRTIYTLVADARGRVWAGAENEIARWNGKFFEAMTPTNGEANFQPHSLFPMKSGALWVLDGNRLRKMEGRAWTAEIEPWRGLLGAASGRAMGAHEDRDGGLWFNHYGNGLFHIAADGKFQRLTAAENLPGDRVGAWFQSSDGGIWAGMDHGGLARLRDRRFHVIGANEGLPARAAAQSVCQDAAGVVWIGTAGGGLCRWESDEGRVTGDEAGPRAIDCASPVTRHTSFSGISRYSVGASASANFVFSISPRADGGAWLSAAEGEDLYQFSRRPDSARVVGRSRHQIHSDRPPGPRVDGHEIRHRVFRRPRAADFGNEQRPRMLPAVRALAETPDGKVWAGADDGTHLSLRAGRPDAVSTGAMRWRSSRFIP